MTNEELLSVAEIVERATNRLHKQAADHETKMAEHRAAFGARTVADAKIIAGLREKAEASEGECNVLRPLVVDAAKYKAERDHFYQREGIEHKRRIDVEDERDGLLTQVQDMRAEIERLKSQSKAPKYKVGDKLESYNRSVGLAIPVTVVGVRTVYDCQADGSEYPVGHSEVELNERYAQTPKHPVKVGEWVRRTTGSDTGRMAQVKSIAVLQYDVQIDGYKAFWASSNCEPCEPPNHDTEAGKAAAERAAKTEPVEIKVGDLVEVVSNRGSNTWFADVGSFGTVTSVEEINDSILVNLDNVPGKKNALVGCVSFCDVRKVTT